MLALFDVQLTHLARYAVMEMRRFLAVARPIYPRFGRSKIITALELISLYRSYLVQQSTFLQFVQVIQPAVLQH